MSGPGAMKSGNETLKCDAGASTLTTSGVGRPSMWRGIGGRKIEKMGRMQIAPIADMSRACFQAADAERQRTTARSANTITTVALIVDPKSRAEKLIAFSASFRRESAE